jgi:hypothetical protein
MIGVVGTGAALALLDEHLPGQSRVWHGVILATSDGWSCGGDRTALASRR